jgi:hypothetical protein
MGEKWPVNLACVSDSHVNHTVLLNVTKRLYFPSEGRHAVNFSAHKIRLLRPSSNPRSWVPEASTLTTRPPKPLLYIKQFIYFGRIMSAGYYYQSWSGSPCIPLYYDARSTKHLKRVKLYLYSPCGPPWPTMKTDGPHIHYAGTIWRFIFKRRAWK